MFKHVGKGFLFLYVQAGMVATLSGCSILVVFAAVTAYLAKQTAWVASHGPLAVWSCAVLAACVGVLIASGIAHFRFKWVSGSAISKWKEEVDSINPLDVEFTRRIIKISDLVNPVTRDISGKRFIDCRLIGPASIYLGAGVNMNGAGVIECDLVPVTNGAFVNNAIPVTNIEVFKGSISGCVIYVHPGVVDTFVSMGASFVALTGRKEIDDRVIPIGKKYRTL